jgi:hypothetical protein
MQPIALAAGIERRVAFVDLHIDATAEQTLGQAQPAEARAGHCHPRTAHQPATGDGEDGEREGEDGGVWSVTGAPVTG